MNYLELQQAVAGYVHRADLTEQIKVALSIANSRIGANLRHASNTMYSIQGIGGGVTGVQSDFQQIIYVAAFGDVPIPLASMTNEQIAFEQKNNKGPLAKYFSVDGLLLKIAPMVDGEYLFSYYGTPAALINEDDTNTVSQSYPQLYIYGALMESFFWTQDGDLTQFARAQFEKEISDLNRSEKTASLGSSPAMRRVY